jgi:hypothetical protein
MAHVNRRQWERFAYPAELQLTATGHVLPAKLVDLSERGMQVVVPVKLYAGNAIRAEVPTPRAALMVTGRVCWAVADRTDGTAQTRAGIAFDLLPTAAEQELRTLASEHPRANIVLQLPGSDDPVRASAIRTEQGIRLSFALPFLREGSIVTLQPSDAKAEVARVLRTHVYAGGTGAETRVELLVQPCAETRKRRFVQYDTVPEAVAEPTPPELEPEQPADSQTPDSEILAVPKQRVLATLGYGASLAAALWLGLRVLQPDAEETVARTDAATRAPTPLRADAIPHPNGAKLETPAPSALRAVQPSAPVGGAPPSAAPAPAAAASDVEPAPDTTPVLLREDTSARVPSAPRAPLVASQKDGSEIFVPISGSLSGLATKIWTDPPAVVVEVPRGVVALPRRRYDLQGDGLIGLSVGRPGGVTQVRVYVNSILSQYDAIAVPGGINIRIKRDLQSLP